MQNLSFLVATPNKAVKQNASESKTVRGRLDDVPGPPFKDVLKDKVAKNQSETTEKQTTQSNAKTNVKTKNEEEKIFSDQQDTQLNIEDFNSQEGAVGAIASLLQIQTTPAQSAPPQLELAKSNFTQSSATIVDTHNTLTNALGDMLKEQQSEQINQPISEMVDPKRVNPTIRETIKSNDIDKNQMLNDNRGHLLSNLDFPKSDAINADATGQTISSSAIDVTKLQSTMETNETTSKIIPSERQQNLTVIDLKSGAKPLDNQIIPSSLDKVSDSFAKSLMSAETATQNSATTNIAATMQNVMQKMAVEVPSSNHINTPFSSPYWHQAVQQKVTWMVGAVDKSATLTLNPPDLGPLKVVVQIDNQSVNTTFISDNPEVRQALQDGMVMLRDKMQENGIQLGQTNVNTQSQSDQAFQEHLAQKAQAANSLSQVQDDNIIESKPMTKVSTTGLGLVDTFA